MEAKVIATQNAIGVQGSQEKQPNKTAKKDIQIIMRRSLNWTCLGIT
jgi:hypothetical protein